MEKNYLSNYGVMIPAGPYREPKPSDSKKWLCRFIGHRWQLYLVTTFGPMPHQCVRCKKITHAQWPFVVRRFIWKCLDIMLRPLCILGWHRWKATFAFRSFSTGGGDKEETEEHNFQCARCPKKKNVKIR